MHAVKRREMVKRLSKLRKTVHCLQVHIKDLEDWILSDMEEDDEDVL